MQCVVALLSVDDILVGSTEDQVAPRSGHHSRGQGHGVHAHGVVPVAGLDPDGLNTRPLAPDVEAGHLHALVSSDHGVSGVRDRVVRLAVVSRRIDSD